MYVQTMGVTVLEGKGYPTEMQNKILKKKQAELLLIHYHKMFVQIYI